MRRYRKLFAILFVLTLLMSALAPAFASDGRYHCYGCTCNQYKYFVDIDLINDSGDTPIDTMGPYETYEDAQQAADNYVYYYPEYSYNIYDAQYCGIQ